MCSFSFFFPTDRPTHLHEREGDGKRNILLGWPNGTKKKSPRHRELVSSLYSSDDPTEASKLLRSSTNLLYSWQYFTLAHSTNCQGYSICYSLSVTYMLDLGKYKGNTVVFRYWLTKEMSCARRKITFSCERLMYLGFWVPVKAGLLSTKAWLGGPVVRNQMV